MDIPLLGHTHTHTHTHTHKQVTKMELQQQQQQIISVESIENSNLRGIITKLINVLLAILAVLLVVVSGVANFIGPFLQTRFILRATQAIHSAFEPWTISAIIF